ncbi:Proteinase inhibitor, propeptide [Phaffia rhodozyma]|uniref:Proteinase inhibitor, propeptide n=1 Tax=Phaffia rhodozyma TaxID=264483 RepID=A0A0F7SIV6_PHARH|nr:Proteinase inhibitor, propeptide [Phaffia rhodozyma]
MPAQNYIVTFKDSAKTEDIEAFYKDIEGQGSTVHKKKHDSSILKYASASLPENLASDLKSHDLIESIEEDQEVKVNPIPGN